MQPQGDITRPGAPPTHDRGSFSPTSPGQPSNTNRRKPSYEFFIPPKQETSKTILRPRMFTTQSLIPDDPGNIVYPEELANRAETNIFERKTQGRRARHPDDTIEGGTIEEPAHSLATSNSSASQKGKRGRRTHPNGNAIPISPARLPDRTQLRRVILDWGKTQVDGAQRCVLNAVTTPANTKCDSQNSVPWQHSEFEDIKLDELEPLVAQLRLCGLQDSDIGLTGRLLKRVRLLSEREFVGGRFLTPKAIRYDMLDDSRYGADKCCIFLNFPYLAVQKPRQAARFKKGDPRHPIRTLLQSRYRLNETTEKDEAQCIRMLDSESLKACIKAPETETSHLTNDAAEELIHVPQMWALVIGLDHLVTIGSLNNQALQGSDIVLNDCADPEAPLDQKLVRIAFMNHGMLDEVTYPLQQCGSWFELLNKHQQIRNALKRGDEKAESKDFLLQIGQHLLEDRTWANVQESAEGKIVKLWMESRKPPKVKIESVYDGWGSEGKAASSSDSESVVEGRPILSETSSAHFKKLEDVPITRAFLAWHVVDDFGNPDNRPRKNQTIGFLNAIYHSLPAICIEVDSVSEHQTSGVPRLPQSPHTARPKIHIRGKTRQDLADLGYERTSELGHHSISIEQLIWWEARKLFNYFIGTCYEEYYPDSAPVQVFWGTLYELMDKYRPYLRSLLDMLEEIDHLAEGLHLGVHVKRVKRTAGKPNKTENDISESAILLASIVDALGAIFNMIVEVIRAARSEQGNRKDQQIPLGKRAATYGSEACRLLKATRGQLIAEAKGIAQGETVGPVVTPEAILIMVMGRLIRGVYGTGSVDIINILEACLEQLALRVEKHSSRRLLQKLNAFEEEVDIVNSVILQQRTVLLQFRGSLDPTEFKRPTTARKLRFEFEKQGIEKILTHIDEQLRNCTELRERAKVLAVQNVQLVETLADDNGRAIFVFTFITVLFLPLSFVAGFFGMNLAGISNPNTTVSHFWYIAVPLTVVILVLCAIFVAWGESIWFAVADVVRKCNEMSKAWKKTKAA